jgi:exonuclease SbcD
MRLLHTADWHLGRVLCGRSLLDQQAEALDRLVDLAVHEKPDAVLVAGDIYDRAIPPTEAMRVLDDTLHRLVDGAGIPVIAIAGNHDGPERLDFLSQMLVAARLHLCGSLGNGRPAVELEDRWGPVHVWPIPYAEPALVRHALNDPGLADHDAALGALLALARARFVPRARQVALCHAFVGGGDAEADHLRPTTLGGAGAVSAARFDGFHYAALGHLHRPQDIVAGRIRYAGSLFPCAFEEAAHPRSATLVEIDRNGATRVAALPLETAITLRTVTGPFDQLAAVQPVPSQDLVRIVLTDPHPVLDPMRRLRDAWPNVIDVQRLPVLSASVDATAARRHGASEPAAAFGDFWRDVFGAEPTAAEAAEAAAAFRGAEQAL